MDVNLTNKQIKFCQEYIIELNATQAAIRAGYSKNTARFIACENLTKPNIQQKLAELQKEVAKRNEVTIDIIIAELKELGFSNISDFMHNGKMLPLAEVAKDKLKAVSQVKLTRSVNGNDKREIIEFKLYDKLSALDKLARHLGFYEIDNRQKSEYDLDALTVEEKLTMLKLLKKSRLANGQ